MTQTIQFHLFIYSVHCVIYYVFICNVILGTSNFEVIKTCFKMFNIHLYCNNNYTFCLVMSDTLSSAASNQLTYFVAIFFSFFCKIHLHSLSRMNPQESISVVLNFLPKTCEVEGNNNLFFSNQNVVICLLTFCDNLEQFNLNSLCYFHT